MDDLNLLYGSKSYHKEEQETVPEDNNMVFGSENMDDETVEPIKTIEDEDVEVYTSEDTYADTEVFTTKKVAEFLNISPQLVRKYAADLEPILHLEKRDSGNTKYNASMWRKSDVKELRRILKIREENGWTIAQTIEALSSPQYGLHIISRDTAALENLTRHLTEEITREVSAAMQASMQDKFFNHLEKMDDTLQKIQDTTALAIENKNDSTAEQLEDIRQELREYKAQLEERNLSTSQAYEERIISLLDENEKDKKRNEAATELYLQKIAELDERVKSRDDEIKALLAEVKEMKLKEEEKKKRWFWKK